MSQREHHSEWAVEQKVQRMLREMQILQQRVEHAIATKDRLPGIGADQVADPKRNNH